MGVTNFDIVQANVFLGANAVTQGNVYYVKPYSGNDGNDGKSPESAFKTLVKAQLAATANQNDIVYFFAEGNTASSTTDYQSVALDWAKDGVHLIGVNSGSMIGQRSRIACLSTVKNINDLFTVSADNCYIANIEVFYGVASCTSTASRAMVVSGQRNSFVNCQISGMGDTSMDDANARSLTVSGSENIFQHCYIGLDTVIRSTNKIEVGITGTASSNATRNIFEDCIFNTYQSNTDAKVIACSYVDRFVMFKNCTVGSAQGITSAAVQTGAISTANMNGKVWVLGSGVFGPADWTTADDSNVLLLSHYSTTVVDMGVAKATDVA
jgi:hypothetical protein